MNINDMNKLETLNERYGPTNLTAFRLVDESTDKGTVIAHIKTDLEILNTCHVGHKFVYRVIVDAGCIDICTGDNGTPVSYFFTEEAQFNPDDIGLDVKGLCESANVRFEYRN